MASKKTGHAVTGGQPQGVQHVAAVGRVGVAAAGGLRTFYRQDTESAWFVAGWRFYCVSTIDAQRQTQHVSAFSQQLGVGNDGELAGDFVLC